MTKSSVLIVPLCTSSSPALPVVCLPFSSRRNKGQQRTRQISVFCCWRSDRRNPFSLTCSRGFARKWDPVTMFFPGLPVTAASEFQFVGDKLSLSIISIRAEILVFFGVAEAASDYAELVHSLDCSCDRLDTLPQLLQTLLPHGCTNPRHPFCLFARYSDPFIEFIGGI